MKKQLFLLDMNLFTASYMHEFEAWFWLNEAFSGYL